MKNSKVLMSNNRITILDSFRALAIMSVLLYHYFYRWNDPIYPYFGGDYFHYGFKGVPFFFIISGFVIFYSLENTSDFVSFWKKRFIRLFPSMLIASIITFIFLLIFDHNQIFADSNYFRNLITSLTFLPPNLFDWIFGTKNHFSYLNYSYWSLWPEIQFYFLSSAIYFFDKFNFKRNYIVACFLLLGIFYLVNFYNLNQIKYVEKIINLFNLIKYLLFFLAGSLFYMLYKNKKSYKDLFFVVLTFIVINFSLSMVELTATLIMYSLFFCFIYYPKLIAFLDNKIFINIGISSYFLYLIHEYIGVVWIRNIATCFYPYSFIVPVLIIILITIFSVLYTIKIEVKIAKKLNNYLFHKKND